MGWIISWMGNLPLVFQFLIGIASLIGIFLMVKTFPAWVKWCAKKGEEAGMRVRGREE